MKIWVFAWVCEKTFLSKSLFLCLGIEIFLFYRQTGGIIVSRFKKILSILVLAFLLVIAVGCNKKVEKGELVSVTVIIASRCGNI